jgi:hypothetical protein
MKVIKIISCSDRLLWYRDLIGQTVPFLGEDIDRGEKIYWSREVAGYKNLVRAKDAEIIELEVGPWIA